jgi:Protein of unknown function (DUF4199)
MQSPPVLKTSLNYGALSGLVAFVIFLLLYWANLNPLGPASWLGAWVPILFMALATRHYRKYENGGYLMYWNGFRISFLTACSSAFVYGALSWFFVSYVDGELLDRFKQESLEAMELSEGMMKSIVGESAFDQSVQSITNMEMAELTSTDVFNKIIGGIFCAFIIAAFYKREPNFQDEE